MEFIEFNAFEGLKNFDPTISTNYCGPRNKYSIGSEYDKMNQTEKQKFEQESLFRIGQYVNTTIKINEIDSETREKNAKLIEDAEIIDIIMESSGDWRLRVRYLLCNNYKGNYWLHYSDLLLKHCHIIEKINLNNRKVI